MKVSALQLCLIWHTLHNISVAAFSPSSSVQRGVNSVASIYGLCDTKLMAKDNESSNDEDDEDWRAFRAKLVMSESTSEDVTKEGVVEKAQEEDDLDGFGALFSETSVSGFTPLDPDQYQWAYDSGKVIEKGAVILGGVEQNFGFGLRQQYFHKSVILVLDHDEHTFTKGIILNRPSDRMMEDDINDGLKWRVWFGGDVSRGIFLCCFVVHSDVEKLTPIASLLGTRFRLINA